MEALIHEQKGALSLSTEGPSDLPVQSHFNENNFKTEGVQLSRFIFNLVNWEFFANKDMGYIIKFFKLQQN